MTHLVLFDLDGTIADDRERAKFYVPGEPSEYWDRERMLADKVYPAARTMMELERGESSQIGILSARLESYNREVTEEWLAKNEIGASPILLRPDMLSHMRPPQYKTAVIYSLLSMYESVVLYDNDPAVVGYITRTLGAKHVVHCTWESEVGEPT